MTLGGAGGQTFEGTGGHFEGTGGHFEGAWGAGITLPGAWAEA
jgi:hypothetical protein